MNDVRLTLRFLMESDWHVGTGSGRGPAIDRAVARDEDGLVYIPAKTVTGMWRDACERLAHGLDGGDPPGGWAGLVDEIFGSQPSLGSGTGGSPTDGPSTPASVGPAPARLSVRPARLPAVLRARLRDHGDGDGPEARVASALNRAQTFVKPAVKIDPSSGTALDGHLRFDEMARGGAVLEATVDLDVDGFARTDVEGVVSFLAAGAALLDRIGGRRRRGGGRCRAELRSRDGQPCEVVEAAGWLEANSAPIPSVREPDRSPVEVPSTGPGRGRDRTWWEIPLVLTLETPLVAPRRILGNVTESFDFVPGALLLPIVARAAAAAGIDAGRAIGAGELVVLPATPDVGDAAGRPAPMALHRPKTGDATTLTNLGLLAETERDDLTARTRMVQLRAGWVGPGRSNGVPCVVSGPVATALTLRMHLSLIHI